MLSSTHICTYIFILYDILNCSVLWTVDQNDFVLIQVNLFFNNVNQHLLHKTQNRGGNSLIFILFLGLNVVFYFVDPFSRFVHFIWYFKPSLCSIRFLLLMKSKCSEHFCFLKIFSIVIDLFIFYVYNHIIQHNLIFKFGCYSMFDIMLNSCELRTVYLL